VEVCWGSKDNQKRGELNSRGACDEERSTGRAH
jgi:hypothetical protein